MSRRATVAALLAASLCTALGGATGTLANHGNALYPRSGTIGETRVFFSGCDLSNNWLSLQPPYSVTASYDTTNSSLSQRVWWTPRVWWQHIDDAGNFIALEHSDIGVYGWFWTWARTGDNHGGMIVFPGVGSIGGGATTAWSDANGNTMSENFNLTIPVVTGNSKQFWAEYIYYWEPNAEQPLDGWASALTTFQSELLTEVTSCVFR